MPQAIAFTHISMPDMKSFRTAEQAGTLPDFLWRQWGAMLTAYHQCERIRLVYLFFAEAYIAYVKKSDRLVEFENIEGAIHQALGWAIREHLGAQAEAKFELIGLARMQRWLEEFDQLSNNLDHTPLRQLVLGQGSEMFYDSPKVVEAMIRIARRHRGEPILRFDQDVTVDCASVEALIAHHDSLVAQGKRYFCFSGTYHAHDRHAEPRLFWLNDYSIRTHFLSLGKSTGRPVDEIGEGADPDIPFVLDVDLAGQFVEDMCGVGADIYNHPISGAGMCLSPMAIVQIPPFANVGMHIVWIDDDLKRCLHEAIGDIPSTDPKLVPAAHFAQDRHDGDEVKLKDVRWAYRKYLQRLVCGCLMHSVIHDPRDAHRAGLFSRYFKVYMRTHRQPTAQERREWAQVMSERLTRLREVWMGPHYADNPAGRPLANYARDALDATLPGCAEVIDLAIQAPLGCDINELCRQHGLEPERSAGWFVAMVLASLENYIKLMNVWPFIIRAIDFEVRRDAPHLEWLTR